MKALRTKILQQFFIIAAVCLLPGCDAPMQTTRLSLQSQSAQALYIYEASIQVWNTDKTDMRYHVSITFHNKQVNGITGLDIFSDDGPVRYVEGSGSVLTSPTAGLHWDFDHITDIRLVQLMVRRVYLFKPKSIVTVRLYTDQKLDPAGAVLGIRSTESYYF